MGKCVPIFFRVFSERNSICLIFSISLSTKLLKSEKTTTIISFLPPRQFPQPVAPLFSDLVRAVTNWYDPIFNFFDFQITNGYTEAMNGLIKIANRIGRGYSFEAIRAKMLFRNGYKTKPSFRKSREINREFFDKKLGQVVIENNLRIWQPVHDDTPIDLGVPITTLTEMIERHEL